MRGRSQAALQQHCGAFPGQATSGTIRECVCFWPSVTGSQGNFHGKYPQPVCFLEHISCHPTCGQYSVNPCFPYIEVVDPSTQWLSRAASRTFLPSLSWKGLEFCDCPTVESRICRLSSCFSSQTVLGPPGKQLLSLGASPSFWALSWVLLFCELSALVGWSHLESKCEVVPSSALANVL